MPRRASLIVAAILAAGGFALPSPIVPSAAAIPPPTELVAHARRRAAGPPGRRRGRHRPGLGRAVEPRPRGDLRRLPEDLLGTRPVLGRLDGHDPQHLGRADRPGRAQHHRARLGSMRPPAGHGRRHAVPATSATRRSSCRSAASCRPAARAGARPLRGAAPGRPHRLELDVHQGERDPRPVSLAALGQPPDRVRPAEPRRPVRDPDQPVVKVRIVTNQRLVLATTGDRTAVSADGLTQTFRASNVRDFTVTAAPDFRTGSRIVGADDRPGLRTGRARPARPCSTPRRTPSSACGARWALSRTRSSRSSSRPVATGWNRRA